MEIIIKEDDGKLQHQQKAQVLIMCPLTANMEEQSMDVPVIIACDPLPEEVRTQVIYFSVISTFGNLIELYKDKFGHLAETCVFEKEILQTMDKLYKAFLDKGAIKPSSEMEH